MRFLLTLFMAMTLLELTACGSFDTGRTFLTEMENDDSQIWTVGKDFPVMAGDSGRDWLTEKERRKRTPQSAHDLVEEQERRSLQSELRVLESVQSEHSLKFYEQYRQKLMSTSEKIYFLKLHPSERRDYLEIKGLSDQDHSTVNRMPARTSFGNSLSYYRSSSLNLGMSKEEVMHSWGRPHRVEVAGNPSFENERWIYAQNGATKYIYFEAGRVGGWE